MSLPDPSKRDRGGKNEEPINTVGLGKITVFSYAIEANLFAAICYLPLFPANIIPCVIALNTPAESAQFIRFNAIQSLIVNGGYAVIGLVLAGIMGVLAMIPLIGGMLNFILGLVVFVISVAYFLLSLKLVVTAFLGQTMELPVIAKYARDYSQS